MLKNMIYILNQFKLLRILVVQYGMFDLMGGRVFQSCLSIFSLHMWDIKHTD